MTPTPPVALGLFCADGNRDHLRNETGGASICRTKRPLFVLPTVAAGGSLSQWPLGVTTDGLKEKPLDFYELNPHFYQRAPSFFHYLNRVIYIFDGPLLSSGAKGFDKLTVNSFFLSPVMILGMENSKALSRSTKNE